MIVIVTELLVLVVNLCSVRKMASQRLKMVEITKQHGEVNYDSIKETNLRF